MIIVPNIATIIAAEEPTVNWFKLFLSEAFNMYVVEACPLKLARPESPSRACGVEADRPVKSTQPVPPSRCCIVGARRPV